MEQIIIPILLGVAIAILRYELTHHEPKSGQDADQSDWRL